MSTTSSKTAEPLELAITDTQITPSARTSPPTSTHVLPDQPLVTIEPTKVWSALNLRDIWHYRELFYFLIWRDIKVRYKQTVIGIAWVIMQPLLSTFIFTLFLGYLARVPSDGAPYPLFVFAGLLPWTFFSGAVVGASGSLVSSANLITKVYFPRMIIPAAAVGARLVDFAIAFGALIVLMLYYGMPLTWRLLSLPLLVILVTLLAVAIGMWMSAINVQYRDVGVALPVLVQFWMFASPVVYSSTLISSHPSASRWKFFYMLNPLVGIIDNFRAAILGSPFNWPALGVSAALTLILLIAAAFHFRRIEKGFADVI
jgi:lipopolysaccharide transport system permease protein